MPTYQYRCRDCGQELEVVQSFKDDALTECPHCQGSLRKVFAAPGITFKGSGFYKNDSRGATTSGGAKGGGDSKPEAKTETTAAADAKSGDTKPASKGETKAPSTTEKASTS